MSRTAVLVLYGFVLVLGWPVDAAAQTPVDSKAWERKLPSLVDSRC
jgi:hypothetical protein